MSGELTTEQTEGCWLTGMPVAISIDAAGHVRAEVYLEDVYKALREEGATDRQAALADAAVRRRVIPVTLG